MKTYKYFLMNKVYYVSARNKREALLKLAQQGIKFDADKAICIEVLS